MPQYTTPPSELEQAIEQASQMYGLPPDLLRGIWKVESGSNYPNPYVNSLGYGGLFGTTDWLGPTQEQANLAAKILRQDISSAHGSVAGGLSSYSGGGYTRVPDETTFGTLAGGRPLFVGRGVPLPGSGPASPGPQQNPLGNTGSLGGTIHSVLNTVNPLNALTGLGKDIEKILLRGLFIMLGLGLAFLGTYMVFRALGGPQLPIPGPGLLKSIGNESGESRESKRKKTQQRTVEREGFNREDLEPAKREDLRPKPVYSTRSRQARPNRIGPEGGPFAGLETQS